MEKMVRKICLDSDALIFLLNKDEKTKDLLSRFDAQFCITAITVFEVGIGKKKTESIDDVLSAFYHLGLDTSSAQRAAAIFRALKEQGMLLDMRDIFIGAICIENNTELFTFNKKHFKRLQEFGLVLA